MNSSAPAERGAAIYRHGWVLAIYDWAVLRFINSYAWRCPTEKHLLPLFRSNVRAHHIDIGVGTGYYLEHAEIPKSVDLTLCDLNPTALRTAKARAARPDANELLCDITKPLPTDKKFDSVSMYYLLHCLPGPIRNKTVVFDHIKYNMLDDGVVTGATVLGKGVRDNLFAKLYRKILVRTGIMDNMDDDPESFIVALKKNFHHVEADVVGSVLIFKALGPRI